MVSFRCVCLKLFFGTQNTAYSIATYTAFTCPSRKYSPAKIVTPAKKPNQKDVSDYMTTIPTHKSSIRFVMKDFSDFLKTIPTLAMENRLIANTLAWQRAF